MTAKAFILSVWLLSSPLFALKEFYSLTKSIRALGMGGAFYGLSDDEYALFYNPAGLSLYNQNSQWMLSVPAHISRGGGLVAETIINSIKHPTSLSNIIDKIAFIQGRPAYFGAGIYTYYIRKHLGIGLLLADTKVNFAFLGREFDTILDVATIVDSGLFVGYARPLPCADYVHLGVTGKAIVRAGGKQSFSLLDFASGKNINPATLGAGGGIDFDLGGTYELRDLPFGLLSRASIVINNLVANDLRAFRNGNPPGLTRMITLAGSTVFEGWEWVDNFIVLLDFAEFRLGGERDPDFGARTGSFWKHVNFGVEMPMRGWFTLRAGFHQGLYTLGFTLNARYLKFDAATYGEELGLSVNRISSRRFAVRVALGLGAPPPPPMVALHRLEKKPPEATPQVTPPEATPQVTPPEATPGIAPTQRNPAESPAQDTKTNDGSPEPGVQNTNP